MRADTDLQAGSHNREEPADHGRRSFLRGVIGGAGGSGAGARAGECCFPARSRTAVP